MDSIDVLIEDIAKGNIHLSLRTLDVIEKRLRIEKQQEPECKWLPRLEKCSNKLKRHSKA